MALGAVIREKLGAAGDAAGLPGVTDLLWRGNRRNVFQPRAVGQRHAGDQREQADCQRGRGICASASGSTALSHEHRAHWFFRRKIFADLLNFVGNRRTGTETRALLSFKPNCGEKKIVGPPRGRSKLHRRAQDIAKLLSTRIRPWCPVRHRVPRPPRNFRGRKCSSCRSRSGSAAGWRPARSQIPRLAFIQMPFR